MVAIAVPGAEAHRGQRRIAQPRNDAVSPLGGKQHDQANGRPVTASVPNPSFRFAVHLTKRLPGYKTVMPPLRPFEKAIILTDPPPRKKPPLTCWTCPTIMRTHLHNF